MIVNYSEQVWLRQPECRVQYALQLHARGLSVIPLKPQAKEPDGTWKEYQSARATPAEIHSWFGNGTRRNLGIALGAVSGLAVVDSDTPDAEAWCVANLPPTPMMTRTAKGFHRYYRLPTRIWVEDDLPAFIVVSDDLKIEVKRKGAYVVAPGSVHPSGHVYAEVTPWPTSLDGVPEFPMDVVATVMRGAATHKEPEPLPRVVDAGGRNTTLHREGSRLRRLGWEQSEIAKALGAINTSRCRPPLDAQEVDAIAASCAKYDPAADSYPLTEAGDAEFFAKCNADSLRYDHLRARWILFNVHHWALPVDGEIDRLALDCVRGRQISAVKISDSEKRKQHMKWGREGEARRRQVNLIALARSIKPLADAGENWDADPWLLGVKNGVIDLQTGQLRAGRTDDRITLVSPLAYNPTASTVKWQRFILDICDDNQELADYLQVSFGYVLTGLTSEQCFWIFYGLGANGKSTLLETFTRHVLPAHSWAMNFPSNTWSESMSEYQRAELVGRRLIVAKENEQAKRLNTEFVKSLTGDETIQGRHPYCRLFNFRPVAKFFLAVNHKPVIRDESHGMWRRVRLVPFLRQFPTNPQFAQDLVADAEGILTWAVEGAVTYRRDGLQTPDCVRAATLDYQNESDILAKFIEDRCVLGPDLTAQAQLLFDDYRRWCDLRREADAERLSQKEFAFRLDNRFTSRVVERKKHYLGLELRKFGQMDLEC